MARPLLLLFHGDRRRRLRGELDDSNNLQYADVDSRRARDHGYRHRNCLFAGALWDPAQLPESRGTVKQYLLAPRGEVDGLILKDGTEVHVPRHLSAQVVFTVRPGDDVSIRGLKARGLPMVDAASITNMNTGKTVVDSGRDARGPDETVSGGSRWPCTVAVAK
jgi:hypothetical protein